MLHPPKKIWTRTHRTIDSNVNFRIFSPSYHTTWQHWCLDGVGHWIHIGGSTNWCVGILCLTGNFAGSHCLDMFRYYTLRYFKIHSKHLGRMEGMLIFDGHSFWFMLILCKWIACWNILKFLLSQCAWFDELTLVHWNNWQLMSTKIWLQLGHRSLRCDVGTSLCRASKQRSHHNVQLCVTTVLDGLFVRSFQCPESELPTEGHCNKLIRPLKVDNVWQQETAPFLKVHLLCFRDAWVSTLPFKASIQTSESLDFPRFLTTPVTWVTDTKSLYKFVEVQGNCKVKNPPATSSYSRPNESKWNVQILKTRTCPCGCTQTGGKEMKRREREPQEPRVSLSAKGHYASCTYCNPLQWILLRCRRHLPHTRASTIALCPFRTFTKSKHTSHMSSNVSDYIHIKYKIIPYLIKSVVQFE